MKNNRLLVENKILKKMADEDIDILELANKFEITPEKMNSLIRDFKKMNIFQIRKLIGILKINNPINFFYETG